LAELGRIRPTALLAFFAMMIWHLPCGSAQCSRSVVSTDQSGHSSSFGFRVLLSWWARTRPAMWTRGRCAVPFGIDALIIVLAARYGEIFWIFPPIVTAVSLAGAGLTYWIGRSAGDAGLPRLISPPQLERIKARLNATGAGALAVAAVLPPPFPLTPVLLTCGALHLDRRRFFLVFGTMRLIRFGTVALLARQYGDRLLQIADANSLHMVITVLIVAGSTMAIASTALLWCRTRPQPAEI
jgi:membrane protein YqaA with SNARE-associated domain